MSKRSYEWRVVTKHDKGTARFRVQATDATSAANIIRAIENCPQRAILSVTRLDFPVKM